MTSHVNVYVLFLAQYRGSGAPTVFNSETTIVKRVFEDVDTSTRNIVHVVTDVITDDVTDEITYEVK